MTTALVGGMFARHRHAGSTMRTNHLSTCVSVVALLAALPSAASANCYSIYDAKNRLAFQSTVAPIDLSARISEAMRARFPGGYLIMIPEDADCREIRTGSTLTPRFDAGGAAGAQAKPEQTLEASPLLRGTGGSSATTREAVRSGNVLNVRRP
jgi:hypothetical protein